MQTVEAQKVTISENAPDKPGQEAMLLTVKIPVPLDVWEDEDIDNEELVGHAVAAMERFVPWVMAERGIRG